MWQRRPVGPMWWQESDSRGWKLEAGVLETGSWRLVAGRTEVRLLEAGRREMARRKQERKRGRPLPWVFLRKMLIP